MRCVAGIDNGTQSTKVLVYDFEGKSIVSVTNAPHELISRDDGTREQESAWWVEALTSCFSRIDPKIKQTIEAVGVSGQQHGFVPVDDQGEVLAPVKLWCDTSTVAQADEITERFGGKERLLQEVGNLVLTGYTAPKILAFKQQHPEEYQKMRWVLLPHDYLNFFLTGTAWMEYGDASGTALLNVKTKRWNKELISCIDDSLIDALPPLIEAHEIGGYVRKEAADHLGIPEGIPVSAGGGDNMMGAVGTGVISEGKLAISLGTSGTMFGYSDKPIIDEGERLAAFCSSSGGWLPLLCTMNCTVATELYRAMMDMGVKEFDNIAAEANPGADGVITIPFFNGERTPNLPHGRGCMVGMTSQNTTKPNMNRSALESAIYGLKMGLEAFEEHGFKAESTYLSGGGAKSPIWRQITADILGIPVELPSVEETAAFGGAVQSLWALTCKEKGFVEISEVFSQHAPPSDTAKIQPNQEYYQIYEKRYEEYKSYVSALTGLFS